MQAVSLRNVLRRCGLVTLGWWAANGAIAGKLDLERNTPVPADQPVPIADFFRPLLLQEPRLNRSGTHIAALVTAGEGRHELMVVELKTGKVDGFDPSSDNDVYQVNWLDDRRLVFGIATRKSMGLGLFAAEVGDLAAAHPLLQYVGSTLIAVPPQNRLRPLVWIRSGSLNAGTGSGILATINTDIRSGKASNLLNAGSDEAVGHTIFPLLDTESTTEPVPVYKGPGPTAKNK